MLKAYCYLSSMRRQRGLTTVEYAVAGGLIAAAVVLAFFSLGGHVGTIVKGIDGALH